jgi:hypothetical protein
MSERKTKLKEKNKIKGKEQPEVSSLNHFCLLHAFPGAYFA